MTIYYFHGGAPDLLKGGIILPPAQTGVESTTLAAQVEACESEKIAQRTDKVYLTAHLDIARMYAALWTNPATEVAGGGSVYQVEVQDGSMEPDQDLLSSEGVSFQADSAVIIRLHDASIPYSEKKIQKTVKRVTTAHTRAKKSLGVALDAAADGEAI